MSKTFWCRFWGRFVPCLLLWIFRGSIPCRERLRRRNEEFSKRSPVLTSGGFATTSTVESGGRRWSSRRRYQVVQGQEGRCSARRETADEYEIQGASV